jgi:hypothetical protein
MGCVEERISYLKVLKRLANCGDECDILQQGCPKKIQRTQKAAPLMSALSIPSPCAGRRHAGGTNQTIGVPEPCGEAAKEQEKEHISGSSGCPRGIKPKIMKCWICC